MPPSDLVCEAALAAFARIDDEDPRKTAQGATVSRRYHDRVARWVETLDTNASIAVRLASRCQHIRRWTMPRTDFDDGRIGYRRWRSALSFLHADAAEAVLKDAGAGPAVIGEVRDLLTKKGLRRDPSSQLLEDAVCLAFLELELERFTNKHPEAKVVEIVQKTWAKMSPAGQAEARALAPGLPQRAAHVLGLALL